MRANRDHRRLADGRELVATCFLFSALICLFIMLSQLVCFSSRSRLFVTRPANNKKKMKERERVLRIRSIMDAPVVKCHRIAHLHRTFQVIKSNLCTICALVTNFRADWNHTSRLFLYVCFFRACALFPLIAMAPLPSRGSPKCPM